ncbi:MAG: adenylate kinase [Clostridiales bacterium]|nr:adenylate kinase [Clostridiales bacterium]
MKNVILLGAPGAGKGTQAALICEEYNVPHISTGDILRRNIKEGTPLGVKAKEYIDAGALVPDEVVIGLVEDRLANADCKDGYVLDGFPRTIAQAEALDRVASIDMAINIDVSFEMIVSRLGGRRVCKCGATYHVSTLNGETKCKACGDELFIRDDDKPETVQNRLRVYQEQTEPLISYYRAQGKLVDVPATGTIEEIFADVKKVLQ